jgi:hypothetical protein
MAQAPVAISRSDPRRRGVLSFACFVAVMCVAAIVARAAAPVELEQLIRQGNEFRQKGSDQSALPFFQKAYDLQPSPRTAAQLGLVELALGYSIQAEGHLGEALSSPHHIWVAKNRQQLEMALLESRKAIGRVEIAGSPAGATVVVNAKVVGNLPLTEPVKVAEGRVQIAVSAPGFDEKSVKVNVPGGRVEKVEIILTKVARAVPSASRRSLALPSSSGDHRLVQLSDEQHAAPGWVRPAAWVTIALTAAAFSFAAVNFVRAKNASDAFNEKTKPGSTEHACDTAIPGKGAAPCAAWASDSVSAQRLGYVGVTGGLLLGGASVMGFLWSRDNSPNQFALVPNRSGLLGSWSARF